MEKLPIIGILGHARVGKDTAARYLVSKRYNSYSIAFADKFKHLLSELHDIPLNYFYDDDLKDSPLPSMPGYTPRILMQETGEHFRQRDRQTWIRYAMRRAQTLLEQPLDILIPGKFLPCYRGSIFISDVRYIDEAIAIWDVGGSIIKISKPSCDGQEQGLGNHISEQDQDVITDEQVQAHIINDGTLEDLYGKLDLYLKINDLR
jgi:hypothetical protein